MDESPENVVKDGSDAVTCWVLIGEIYVEYLGAVQTHGVPAAYYWPGPSAMTAAAMKQNQENV